MEDKMQKLMKIIDEDVRPILLEHYGDIEVISFEDGVMRFKLLGQCSGCPSAKFTVEDVIEGPLKEKMPEVQEVILENTVSEELLDMARNILNKNK